MQGDSPLRANINLLFRAIIARTICVKQFLALSGTLEAVFNASTHARQAASMLTVSIWRELGGLSHLQATRMDGKEEFASASNNPLGETQLLGKLYQLT